MKNKFFHKQFPFMSIYNNLFYYDFPNSPITLSDNVDAMFGSVNSLTAYAVNDTIANGI